MISLAQITQPCTACGQRHEIAPSQFPPGVLERLEWHRGQLRWTTELFAWMREHPAAPDDYPGAWVQLCDAIDSSYLAYKRSFNLSDDPPRTALVVGSMSPWIECIILSLYTKCLITVTDHNPIEIHHDRVQFRPADRAYDYRYDLVVSFSSVEHFGLGRYGDAVNPNADLQWMQMAKRAIAPAGRLLLAVPQGPEDRVEACWHRIYGPQRMTRLLEGWTVVGKHLSRQSSRYDWQNQPALTLITQTNS